VSQVDWRCNRCSDFGVATDVTDRDRQDAEPVDSVEPVEPARLTEPAQLTEHDEASDALLRRLADDLDGGFVELVRRYERVMFTVAVRASGQAQDAEDLVAEAFLRAYRALRGYDRTRIIELRPRTWLLRILVNLWRNVLRDRDRRPRQVPLGDVVEPASAELSAVELAEHGEDRAQLAAMVRQLPDAQRHAVVLRHVCGLSIAEIAAILHCAQGTAKSHISRGLHALRALDAADHPLMRGRCHDSS
jgi:RNA polymerase sigma-70 factor, ECF subfamily